MKLWEDTRKELEAAGLDEQSIETARRLTAGERHMARKDAALKAAEDYMINLLSAVEAGEYAAPALAAWIGKQYHVCDYRREAAARVLCWAEAGGLYGGGLHDPGAGTDRHLAFRDCGKGRRQASDGPAWTAAIEQAAWAPSGKGWEDRPTAVADGVQVGVGPAHSAKEDAVIPWGAVRDILGVEETATLLTGLLAAEPQKATPKWVAWLRVLAECEGRAPVAPAAPTCDVCAHCAHRSFVQGLGNDGRCTKTDEVICASNSACADAELDKLSLPVE